MSKRALNYGENPQQTGAVLATPGSTDALGIPRFTMPDGTPALEGAASMSWATLKALDTGLEAITRIAACLEKNVGAVPKIAVLITHGTPFAACVGSTDQVINRAIQSNFRAAFGSFLVTNVELSEPVAYKVRQWMGPDRPFLGLAAPRIDAAAAPYFVRKKGKCHLLMNEALGTLGVASLAREDVSHTVRGATLSQMPNPFLPEFPADWDASLRQDMSVAWGVCAASASSSITVANDGMLIANASGHIERAAAAEMAILQAKVAGRVEMLEGAAVCSDSFFSFADALDPLARRKVKAIFATHGSVHDDEVRAHAREFDVIFHTVPDREGRIFYGH
ncbi:MAG: hypothetical protein NW217_13020 [Hyphomicrobiaceae bacterium]|nr:hypothetical protein [Hyphomicrobiaceae bacterium]